jgi:hypothetical protein
MLWGDLYHYYMNYTAHSGREVGTTVSYTEGPGISPLSLQTDTTPFEILDQPLAATLFTIRCPLMKPS